MQDIFGEIKSWIDDGKPFALATVINTWGSSPRGVGAAMAVTKDQEVVGSVSGGCIEGAVIEEAQKVLESGGARQLNFGVSDDTAWSVGLTCGGKVSLLVEKHFAFSTDRYEREIWKGLKNAIEGNQPAILLTRLESHSSSHLLAYPDGSITGDWGHLNEEVIPQALRAYEQRKNQVATINQQDIFVQIFPRKDRMLIIGAAHISIPLVKFAKEFDFEVTIIDPRKVFATPERFPTPPEHLFTEWPEEVLPQLQPDEDTYAVLLTHDPKIDDVALHHFLKSDVAYIGALGSRKTHAKRCERLKEAGFSEEIIARIRGPAGLDIHAQTPAEIALSIMAQVIETKRRRSVSTE